MRSLCTDLYILFCFSKKNTILIKCVFNIVLLIIRYKKRILNKMYVCIKKLFKDHLTAINMVPQNIITYSTFESVYRPFWMEKITLEELPVSVTQTCEQNANN